MKRFLTGLACGLLIGALGGGILWIMSLPAPPSAYRPKFPIATTDLPDEAVRELDPARIGFDLYMGRKPRRILKKSQTIPFRKSSGWLASSGQNGALHLYETFWVEYEGQLYQLAHLSKKYETEPNKNMSMLKVIEIQANRRFTVRMLIPDADLDETFGPFELPSREGAEHPPGHVR